MAREIVTTGVLRLDKQEAERSVEALDKRIDALYAKARKGGGVGPLFGGGGGPGGGRPSAPPVPDTAKLQKAIQQQTRINELMREAGVTSRAASQVVKAYGNDVDVTSAEMRQYAVDLDRAQREQKQLTAEQRAADAATRSATKTSRSHLLTVRDLYQAYGLLVSAVGVRALTSALTTSVTAWENQQRVTAQVEARLKSTGNVVGLTAQEIDDFADRWQRATGIADEETEKLASQLLTFRGVAKEVFFDAIAVAQDMAVVWDKDVRESALQVFKALEDPERGMTALRRSGSQLSATEEQLVRDLLAVGDAAGAQRLIITSLQTQYGGAAQAAREAGGSIGALKTEIGDLSEVIGGLVMKQGGGGGLVEFLVESVRVTREAISVLGTEAKTYEEVARQAELLAAADLLVVKANKAAGGSAAWATKKTEEHAAGMFRAAAFARKYAKELLGPLQVTTRYSAANEKAEFSASQHEAAEKRLGRELEKNKKIIEEAEEVRKSLRTAQEVLDDELERAEALYSSGLLLEEDMARAKKRHSDETKKLADEESKRAQELKGDHDAQVEAFRKIQAQRESAKQAIQDEIDALDRAEQIVREYGVTQEQAAEAAQLMADANISAAEALNLVQQLEAKRASASGEMGPFLTPEAEERIREAARLTDALKTRTEVYREEVQKIADLLEDGYITDETADRAIKHLNSQMELWERIAMAAEDAAERAGGAWGSVLSGIAKSLQGLVGALDQMAQIAAARGDTRNAQLLGGVSALAQGDWGGAAAGLAQGLGLTGGGTSQFGGKKAGNMMAEGAQIGNTIWPGWGALIGAVVGAFVKTGADDFHAEMEESAGKAGLVISQAEGELGKVGEKLSAFFNTFLNELQAGILADLDLAGSSFHIRGDRVRVVSNGIEKVFHSLEEGMDFFIRGILQANATVDGLGDNVRAFFEGANQFSENLGDLEKLQAGLDLAQRLDFAETGIDTRSINAFRKELELAAEFGIPLEKVVALRQREIAAIKEELSVRARGMLGATDFAGPVIELTRGMEVFNNTATKQAEMDRKRVEELNALIAAQEQTLTSTEGVVTGFEQGIGVQGRFRDGIARDGEAMDSYTGQLDETTRSHIDGQRQLDKYKEELDALNESLAAPPDTFAQEEMGRLWEKAVADAGMSLLNMIEAVEGPAATVEERRQLQHTIFMLQLGAQIQAAQVVLETMQFVSDASRELFQGIITDAQQLFNDLASGEKTLRLGGAGGGRRQQKLEEQRRAEEEAERAAEQAAERLEDFTKNLRYMELNARTASGTLGDLAARLDDIAEASRQAAEDGASAAEVMRFQRLSFRTERERILAPFDTGPRNFAEASVDIERQRRDSVEQARLLAMAESEALGIPFDVIFDALVADIDKGAARAQRELTRAMIDALNLPLEQVRRDMQSFRKALDDLDLAYKRGEISQARYLDLQEQIQKQQAAAVGGQALSMLDKYYSEVEGREEFRRAQEQANFELELATLRLRFNMLVAEGALAQDVIDSVGGFITFMEENPPDWDAFFAPPEGGGGAGFGGGSTFSASSIASDFSNLAGAIRDFVHGFNQIEVGQFTAQAREWLKALEDFDRDIGELLSDNPTATNTIKNFAASMFGITDITQLTADQLAAIGAAIPSSNVNAEAIGNIIEVLQAAGGLGDIRAQAPDKILSMYEGTLEATNELADQYATINSEFLDAVTALSELGASAEDIARAEEIHQERLLGFWVEALSGFKSLSDEIRGGAFGGVNLRSVIESSQSRIDSLRARVAANPEDFEALQALEAELRNQLELQKEFSGGVLGPEFERIAQEILGISDLVQQQALPPELQPDIADPLVLSKMDEQTTIFSEIRDIVSEQEDRQIRSDLALRTLIDENTRTLASLQRSGSPLTTQA